MHQPYGLEGGSAAACGQNMWIKQRRMADGDCKENEDRPPRQINLGGKATVKMGKNDRIIIATPGGGGWGTAGGQRETQSEKKHQAGLPRYGSEG